VYRLKGNIGDFSVQDDKMLVLCGLVGDDPTYGDLVHYLAYHEATATITTISVFRELALQRPTLQYVYKA
jgi:hypothetical protein